MSWWFETCTHLIVWSNLFQKPKRCSSFELKVPFSKLLSKVTAPSDVEISQLQGGVIFLNWFHVVREVNMSALLYRHYERG